MAFQTVQRNGSFYIVDDQTNQRVSPQLPNKIMVEQFMQGLAVFGIPSPEDLLSESFDWMKWMKQGNRDENSDEYSSQDYIKDESGGFGIVVDGNGGGKIGGGPPEGGG